jgi:hypothetical protein
MITEVATFLKPCAFGAPQAASGLDQRRHLGEGAAVSSMPHCRVRQGRQISALTRGASYESGPGKAERAAWKRVLREAAVTPNTKRTQRLRGVWE